MKTKLKLKEKDLKKFTRLSIMTSPLLDHSIQVFQMSVNNDSWRDHFSLERGRAAQEWDGQARCLEGRHGSGNLGTIGDA
jgi:hypothetical protein